MGKEQKETVKCEDPAASVGRKVRIEVLNYLTLCEVKVFTKTEVEIGEIFLNSVWKLKNCYFYNHFWDSYDILLIPTIALKPSAPDLVSLSKFQRLLLPRHQQNTRVKCMEISLTWLSTNKSPSPLPDTMAWPAGLSTGKLLEGSEFWVALRVRISGITQKSFLSVFSILCWYHLLFHWTFAIPQY